MLALSIFDLIRWSFIQAAPAMPPEAWAVTGLVAVLLLTAAGIDAATGIVPDPLIFAGLAIVTGAQGWFGSWDEAARNLRCGIAAALVIWAVNVLWYRFFRRDALGMGDAKWTMLAVACFGAVPGVLAWGIGALTAVVFLGLAYLCRRRWRQIYFAPFLAVGLMAGLYWLRFYLATPIVKIWP